jgi:hypothetical protein
VIPPAPPVFIRQQPPKPKTPEPLVIREAPPKLPEQVSRKVITISGKKLPPPARKVIVERLPPLPPKPQSILIEKWLPYPEVKRKVIYNKWQSNAKIVKPKNLIINWETPKPKIKKEIRYLGVVKADPEEYSKRYKENLKDSNNLPSIVNEVPTPTGLVLAADQSIKMSQTISQTTKTSTIKSKFDNLNDTFELSEKRKLSTPLDRNRKIIILDDTFSLSSSFESKNEKERILSFIKEFNNSLVFDNLSTFSSIQSTKESGGNFHKIKSCSSIDKKIKFKHNRI